MTRRLRILLVAACWVGAPGIVAVPTDPAELEAFVDGLMAAQLEELDTAGAVVAFVKDGEPFFAKGYGYADQEKRIPVDPDETLFRIGSVSKLFVWTSVMQLVEEGRLDLHADINEYLVDIEIPRTYDEPVTLAHLMTHTPGFEDWVVGLFGNDETSVRPMEEILIEQLPARVRPPGAAPSYSNHGTGMAAYIVETVSGQPWQEFVQERILNPLEMEQTTFAQPLPGYLADKLSKGYKHAGDHFEEQAFEWVPLAPVGAAASSAADMARFMIAHLQLGRLGDQRILKEETARRMQSELHRVDPAVNPMRHGFIDMSLRGVEIIGHGGDTFWFHTGFALFPEHDLGLFVSYNTEEGAAGRGAFLEAFVERYFPEPEEDPTPPEDFAERAALYAGTYRANRFSHTTLAKVAAAVDPVTVTATDDGLLHALERRWVEIAPRVLREQHGNWTLVFRQGDDGRMRDFYITHLPIVAFERIPAGESPGLHMTLLVLAALMMAATVVAWPGGWAVRRWFGVPHGPQGRIPGTARLVLWLAALLLLLFAIGFASVLGDPTDLARGELGPLTVVLTLPIGAALLTLVSLVFAVQAWRLGQGGRTGRVLYSLSVLAFLVFFWQLNVWNLLGFRF